nr:putative reverse transcriptase domain-containing protein [Tanacetum cinerariifolium]
TDSPGYVSKSDPEENSEEDDEDPEEDPADYPTDRDDDDKDDDDDKEPSGGDADDEEDEEEDEEEEHPTLSDSVMPPLVHRVTTRMYIRAQTLVLLPSDTKVARLLAMPTPPPSPLPQIPSSPLPLMLSRLLVSPPLPVSPPPLPANPTYPLGYRAAMIRLRPETPSASHLLPLSTPPSGTPPLLPIPVPTSSPPMLFPSTVCRVGTSEVTLPPQKRLYTAMGLRYEKSYADLKLKPMEFQVGDKVMLKVLPWKGVVRFRKRVKLIPRFVGPFKKCHADEPLAVPLNGLHFDDKLHFVEEPVEIVDHEVRRLKRSQIPLVKV